MKSQHRTKFVDVDQEFYKRKREWVVHAVRKADNIWIIRSPFGYLLISSVHAVDQRLRTKSTVKMFDPRYFHQAWKRNRWKSGSARLESNVSRKDPNGVMEEWQEITILPRTKRPLDTR
ncbi:hypothetical protein Tcan_05080 [Toxocara canis]|uniref:Uncharacterized protein n=1 Tax=Toxocara canis TaxID=6265 RepID=A0A0B2V7E2_TOXCA|nr:hypothetical protein Tcan_05080 [Toxocara canis]